MEKHPIPDGGLPNETLEQRIRRLEMYLGMLWDQVWWMNLPPEKRLKYQLEGFKDPIEKFYIEE